MEIRKRHWIFLLFIFKITFTYAETNYSMDLRNGVMIDHRTYEFEVYIKSNNQSFILTSYQCVFLFNPSIINNGFLTFTYIQGTSQLNNKPVLSVGVKEISGLKKLTFASQPGNDIIYPNEKRVGKFRLKNTTTFGGFLPAIKWSFDQVSSTLITGENFLNITRPYLHNYDNIGLPIYIESGWNFISVPLRASNMSVVNLFPTAVSNTFEYINDRYEVVDTFQTGKGYWINFNEQSATEIKGNVDVNPIAVDEGWNLIGNFHYSLLTNSINSIPANIISSPFFGWKSTFYQAADYLEIGKAYWVKITNEGHLLLSSSNQNP